MNNNLLLFYFILLIKDSDYYKTKVRNCHRIITAVVNYKS